MLGGQKLWREGRVRACASCASWLCACAFLLSACGGRSQPAQLEESGDGDVSGDGDGDRPGPTECSSSQQCAPDERCQDEFCVPACGPYSERCTSDGAEFCDPDVGWTLFDECALGEICFEDGVSASCRPSEPMQCPPGETWCSSDHAVLWCTPDGTIVELFSCTEQGGVCIAGGCVPWVCEPGTVYCQNDSIYVCAPDGASATLIQTCAPSAACFADPEPRCQELFCAPNSAVCQDNFLLVCNELGTAWSAAVDCGQDLCVDGACRPVVCTPGELDCDAEGVLRCSDDGTAWLVADDCSDSEYCVVGMPSCQPRECVPDAPVCLGNTTAQCNSEGSGYLLGTDCGSLMCVSGTCRDALSFFEGFEDGDLGGWMAAGVGYSYSVVSSTSGEGTRSVTLSGGVSDHYDGIFYLFPERVTPARVSYRARHDGGGSGTYFTLHDAVSDPGTDNEALFVYFRGDGFLAIGSPGGSEAVRTWQAQRWYDISVDFDWDARTFDISVDGVVYLTENPFRGGVAVSGIRMMSLYHYDASVGYWDDIRFE